MALVYLVVALAILGFLYVRMIRREKPGPIGKAQAVVPIILGAVSTPLSLFLFIGLGLVLIKAGYNAEAVPPIVRSFIYAFVMAGLPEEITKLVMMLITLLIFRKKVKNVYEIVLVGAAVGLGFTLFEEFLYGSSSGIMAAGRLLTVAAHMALGVVMATHLGRARFNKATGAGGVAGEYALAIILPVAAHTLYDAFTASNKLLESTDDTIMTIGVILGIIVVIAMFIWQIIVIRSFKKNADKYCAMELGEQAQG